jgi:S-formylglutathione hydrolase FrmB
VMAPKPRSFQYERNHHGILRRELLRIFKHSLLVTGVLAILVASVIRVASSTGQVVGKAASMTVAAPTVDSNGVKYYSVTSFYQGSTPQIVRVLEPTHPAPGKPRRLLYVLPVEAGVTTQHSQFGDGLEELRLLDVQDRFNMTLIAPSFRYEPWYGDNANDTSLWMESFITQELVPWGDTFLPEGTTPQRFLVGFSKSGNGALILLFRHPNTFRAAAAWDSPAQLSDIAAFPKLTLSFGTQANYNHYFIPSLVTDYGAQFTTSNRIWISGDQSLFTADMNQLHAQLKNAGIPHTWMTGGTRAHHWSSGWLDHAVASLDANSSSTATTRND